MSIVAIVVLAFALGRLSKRLEQPEPSERPILHLVPRTTPEPRRVTFRCRLYDQDAAR